MLPVFFKSQSVATPPTVSPMTPAKRQRREMPTLISVKCLKSTR
jgi:hypothetical protein